MSERRRPCYKYLQSWIDAHGRVHVFFRRRGRRIRLPNLIGSPEFILAYTAALNEQSVPSTLPESTKRKRLDHEQAPLVGVYLLMHRGQIVYVGSSLNMPLRVTHHRSNGRPFDQAFYIATEAGQREALERVLIRAINPKQNRHGLNGTGREVPVSKLDAEPDPV